MASNAAFEHTREVIETMSHHQLIALQKDLEARINYLTIPTRVFNITEILEKILTDLDFFQIFQIMRVSRKFRDSVIGSKALRTKLYMHAEGELSEPGFFVPNENPLVTRTIKGTGFVLLGVKVYDAEGSRRAGREAGVPLLEYSFRITWDSMQELVPPDQKR